MQEPVSQCGGCMDDQEPGGAGSGEKKLRYLYLRQLYSVYNELILAIVTSVRAFISSKVMKMKNNFKFIKKVSELSYEMMKLG